MKCFIRSAAWITASFGQRFAGKNGANFQCKPIDPVLCLMALMILDNEVQRDILRNDPERYLAYRKKIESELNSRFRFILNGSQEQQEARVVSTTHSYSGHMETDFRFRLLKETCEPSWLKSQRLPM